MRTYLYTEPARVGRPARSRHFRLLESRTLHNSLVEIFLIDDGVEGPAE